LVRIKALITGNWIKHPTGNGELHIVWQSHEMMRRTKGANELDLFAIESMVTIADCYRGRFMSIVLMGSSSQYRPMAIIRALR
jgi:hypothetical protein